MSKKNVVDELSKACDENTLMTSKHDPDNLGKLTWGSYRTVLSYDMASNLESFIKSESYDLIEYENLDTRHPSKYIEFIPTDSSFSVPASGVGPDDLHPSEALDRLVAVWGNSQGLHLFGEASSKINDRCRRGKLSKKGKLK
jgi:hypothetical protein